MHHIIYINLSEPTPKKYINSFRKEKMMTILEVE